jgi:hypothetical protein
MKDLTYDQLIKLAPKDRPFQIEVESNPFGEGGSQILWGYLYQDSTDTELDTGISNQQNIDGINYNNRCLWKTKYKGTFTLIDPRYQKPEEIKLGTEVEILESARDIEEGFEQETYICKIGRINIIQNDYRGLWYGIVFDDSNHWIGFPHYCVRPVEEEEDDLTVKLLINDLEELLYEVDNNTHNELKDIISKYKK